MKKLDKDQAEFILEKYSVYLVHLGKRVEKAEKRLEGTDLALRHVLSDFKDLERNFADLSYRLTRSEEERRRLRKEVDQHFGNPETRVI